MTSFSIIIPVVQVNDYIRETVPYIQNLLGHEWELLIISNHDENTEWPNDNRIKLVASGRVGPADKRDLGASLAIGDILVFLDDDSYPESDLLEVATDYFKDSDVIAIGGPGRTPIGDTYWQRVSGAVFLSRYTGGAPERYAPVGPSREIDDWPSVNLMVRKNEFLGVGGFDSEYWPGEDTKLCLKLKKVGHKMVYAPNLIVWHHRRSGVRQHLRQIGAYGLHRGYFARHYPETSLRLKYFLPSLFFLFVSTTPIGIYLSQLTFKLVIIGWIAYGIILIIGLIEALKFERFHIVVVSLLYTIPTHFFYGLQFIRGFGRRGELTSVLRT